MKITFLGTACGVPQKDRYCSSALVECGGRSYMIDAGAPVTELLCAMGKTPCDLSAIFITHSHGDHVNGLSGLVDIMSWYYKDADPMIFLPEISYARVLERWERVLLCGKDPRLMRFTEVKEGIIYDDGVLRVSAFLTKHMKVKGDEKRRPSYAYLLEAIEGGCEKRVLFTGDMSHSCEDYPSVAYEKRLDAIVCEAAHFDINRRREIFGKSNTDKFLINHAGVRIARGELDGIREFCDAMPFSAWVVCDGEEVTL